jgi:hypothetical protein
VSNRRRLKPPAAVTAAARAYRCGHCQSTTGRPHQDPGGIWHLGVRHDTTVLRRLEQGEYGFGAGEVDVHRGGHVPQSHRGGEAVPFGGEGVPVGGGGVDAVLSAFDPDYR